MIKKIIFKGITFSNFKNTKFVDIFKPKGLYLFPSAPGISSIDSAKKYYNSLKKADLVFFDSSFFVILLKIFKNINVERFSGYKFLKYFFIYLKKNNNSSIFLIEPSKNISVSNKKYILNLGIKKKNFNNYIAPIYNSSEINDQILIKNLKKKKPNIILINIGGGVQEVLGLYLKKNLHHNCKILCTGAAISFFTGQQAPINDFIDKFYLGWLIRIIYNPKMFYKRYFYSLKLVKIVMFNRVKIIR